MDGSTVNDTAIVIKKCESDDEISSTFSVMQQLRTSYQSVDQYLKMINAMRSDEGYVLVGLFINEECVAVAGYRILTKLVLQGKEMYMDDYVTDKDFRGEGYGAKLFIWLKQEAEKLQCRYLSLDSGAERDEAHRFYLKQGMLDRAKHFMLKL